MTIDVGLEAMEAFETLILVLLVFKEACATAILVVDSPSTSV